MKKYFVTMEATAHFTVEVSANSVEDAVILAASKDIPKTISPEEVIAVSAEDENSEESWSY